MSSDKSSSSGVTALGFEVLQHTEVLNRLETPDPARKWLYIDVRTPVEFSEGHIPGAYNVPFKHGSIEGLRNNPDFTPVILARFERSQPLIVGCRSGARAKAACSQLSALGYTTLALHEGSLAGSRDHFGRLNPGWLAKGLPVTTSVEPGRSYAELQVRDPLVRS